MFSFLAPGPNRAPALRVLVMLAVLSSVYGLQQLGTWWYPFAIRPNQPETWLFGWGSFLLHGSLGHLGNNAFGLAMILWVWPRLFEDRVLWFAVAVIQAVVMFALYVLSGADVLVIGASHLMYGFWVLMGVRVVIGMFRQGRTLAAWQLGAVLVGFYTLLLVEAYYQATGNTNTSWEGHVAGMSAGALCAWLWRNAAYPALPPLTEALQPE